MTINPVRAECINPNCGNKFRFKRSKSADVIKKTMLPLVTIVYEHKLKTGIVAVACCETCLEAINNLALEQMKAAGTPVADFIDQDLVLNNEFVLKKYTRVP